MSIINRCRTTKGYKYSSASCNAESLFTCGAVAPTEAVANALSFCGNQTADKSEGALHSSTLVIDETA